MFPRNPLRIPCCLSLGFAALLGAAVEARSAEPYFTGTVVDALTGYPLIGAAISADNFLTHGRDTIYTNGQGRFEVSLAMWNASIGLPIAVQSAAKASAGPGADVDAYRADGRAVDGSEAGPPPGILARASVTGEKRPLAKAAQTQGGAPFRVSLAGYYTRETRMRSLALRSSIHRGDPEPDYDLVIPLVPQGPGSGCPAP